MPGDMKAKIADTLNEILKHKELDKITVKELVEACNISRQSFYYHFQDIMDVVEWYQDQALRHSIAQSLEAPTYREAIRGVVYETVQHKQLILQLLASQRRQEIEDLLVKAVCTYLEVLWRGRGARVSCTADDAETILTFCSCGLVGMMLMNLRRKDLNVDELAEQMCRLLTGEIVYRFVNQDAAANGQALEKA